MANNINNNGLYSVFLQRLSELEKSSSKNGIIRFPTVFKKICQTFMVDKQTAWELLFFARDLGFIEIVRFQGIKLNEEAFETFLKVDLKTKKFLR